MTEAEMKSRYERSDPSILVNCEIGPRDHGRFSLRLVARRTTGRVAVSLERWHQPEGSPHPVAHDIVQYFPEQELGRLAWGIWSARQEVHAEGRETHLHGSASLQPERSE